MAPGCQINQAQLPVLADLTQQSEQMVNFSSLHKRGSLSEILVPERAEPQAPVSNTFGLIGAIRMHESPSSHTRIHELMSDGEITNKASIQEIPGPYLTVRTVLSSQQTSVDGNISDVQAGGVSLNLSANRILAAEVTEMKTYLYGSLCFQLLFSSKRRKKCQAWNILNFMKPDPALDLAQSL